MILPNMRTDKYMMAKAWMKQDQAPQSEALDTWNTLEAEFNEERKAMLMASAETDKIKEAMNKKYGPGTVKYGSEIKQPEMKTPQAIFEFSQRNPAADGGRMGFSEGKGKFKSGESFKTVKEFKNVSGPGTGLGYENPANIKKAKIALNKIKKQRNKKLFFDYKEEDVFFKKLMEDVDLSRENLSKLIKNTIAQEFPGAYVGKEGRKQHKIDTVVKSFLSHYDHNGSFDGNEKMAKILEQFHGGYNHKFEAINNTFRDWVRGYSISNQGNKVPVEVEGIDRANLDQDLLKDLKKWKPNSKPQKNLMVQSELKFLNDLNSKGTYRNAPLNYERVQQLYRDFMKKEFPNIENVDNRFFHRLNQLTELKQTGSYSTGNGNFSKIPGITGDKNRADWLKKGFGIQFQGNYSKIILKADKLLAEGNKAEANRLYKAADKFFGPDGIFTKAEGEGEHPFSRKWGRGKIGNELKINSLVKSDLNQFKRANFDIPVTQLFNEYKVADPKRQKEIAMEIEDRKKLMNYLTEGPNTKGIVEPVKFNYGKTSIGASVDVPDIDKIKNFDVQEFITRGEDYRGSFLTQGEEFNLVDKNKNIISSKIPDEEFRQIIKSIGCPNNKAGGGRIEFQDGLTCFDKGQKLINNGMKDASQASMRNFSKFANSALKLGRNVMKFGVIPEAMFIGAESLVRMGMGDTLSEASKQAVGFYLDPIFGTNFKKEGAFSKMEGDVGTDMAFDVSRLNEYKESLAKVQSITNAKNQALAVNDESLTGLTDQEVAAQYDANIAKAQAELNKRMLSETERVDFENKADTAADVAGVNSPIRQAIGKARSDTEMMRYENDFTGMQSDMFTQDPMSQKTKTERLSNLLPQKSMRPGLSQFVNFNDRQLEQLSGLTKKPVKELRDYQDYLNDERKLSFADQEKIFGKEQTYGTQGNFFGEKLNEKPVYDFSEGGITALRSKYEYKK